MKRLIKWFGLLGGFYVVCIGVEFYFALNFMYSLVYYAEVE